MELNFLRPTQSELNYFRDHYHPENITIEEQLHSVSLYDRNNITLEEQLPPVSLHDRNNITLKMSLSDFTQMVRDTMYQNVNVEEIKDLKNLCAIRYKEDALNLEQLHMLLLKLIDTNPSVTFFALPDQYYLEGMDVQQLKEIRNHIDELIASSDFDAFASMNIQT